MCQNFFYHILHCLKANLYVEFDRMAVLGIRPFSIWLFTKPQDNPVTTVTVTAVTGLL